LESANVFDPQVSFF